MVVIQKALLSPTISKALTMALGKIKRAIKRVAKRNNKRNNNDHDDNISEIQIDDDDVDEDKIIVISVYHCLLFVQFIWPIQLQTWI